MLSKLTCIELAYLLENLSVAEIDRIFVVFEMKFRIYPPDPSLSKAKKATILLEKLTVPTVKGPFTDSFQMDMLQYLVNHYYRNKKEGLSESSNFSWDRPATTTSYEDLFSHEYFSLANSLKRDGYRVKGRTIQKSLPEEIVEAKTESELERLLDKFAFKRSKEHLEQAIANHSQGIWAAANAQFRTFIESLLMEISNLLIPARKSNSAGEAIQFLSNPGLLSSPFLSEELNEIQTSKNGIEIGFVNGLWKRMHPEGSHPGLSDEEDSTFRYHICIVFTHYLLNRLASR